jgi:hypothetical protein
VSSTTYDQYTDVTTDRQRAMADIAATHQIGRHCASSIANTLAHISLVKIAPSAIVACERFTPPPRVQVGMVCQSGQESADW